MNAFCEALLSAPHKKAMPILSFPSVSLTGIQVEDYVRDPALQADGMKRVAERCPTLASVSMMDLSVEAEAFGAPVLIGGNAIPSVTDAIVHTLADAEALPCPKAGAGRTGLFVEAIRLAKQRITDRPVFCGVIGPYSLAGRLIGVSDIMMDCYMDEAKVNAVLRKATDFLIDYLLAYKKAGADGVILAEPLPGLISPDMSAKFSAPYVKELFDAARGDGFILCYHNCGGAVLKQMDSILSFEPDMLHFGNSIHLADAFPLVPEQVIVSGNLDPSSVLRNASPDEVYAATRALMAECGPQGNFLLSSGCDMPPDTPWENIDAFFRAAEER